jgi:hypothetical protein
MPKRTPPEDKNNQLQALHGPREHPLKTKKNQLQEHQWPTERSQKKKKSVFRGISFTLISR